MATLDASSLEAGRDASRRYEWGASFDLLSTADADGRLSPPDLELLAEAAWWTGRLGECIAARERAYAAYVQTGETPRAALIAAELSKNYFAKGEASVGAAWLNRAERLLQGAPRSIAHGHVARMRAVVALELDRDNDAALSWAQQTLDIATKFGDRDLMAVALHDQGRALVGKGQVAAGMALIDEATVAAVAGELGPYATAIVYCNTITACMDLSDYRRAGEWSEAAKRWCDRQAISGFPGMCRVYRAGIMRLRGTWSEAEQEARRACEELREFNLGYAAQSLYELGEVRLLMGDLGAAEDAFRQAHALGRDPQPGLARLRLAQENVKSAASMIARALADESVPQLSQAQLLPAQVEIALAAGDVAAARAASDTLTEIAGAYGTPGIEAAATEARGAVMLAEGDPRGADRHLRRAHQLWQEIDCPYHAARTRTLLAAAYRAQGDEEAAVLELQAAREAFEGLGARLGAQLATAMLGTSAATSAPRATPPEQGTKTFMFTDIVKSTNLVDIVGDAAWIDLMRWHDETLRSLFVRHGGEEVDHTGDGFLVAFVDATSAIGCAVAIQRTLADHRRRQGFAPQVRIGLHAAVATHAGGRYRGKGVHAAARIGALAEGEQIVASGQTAAAAAGRFKTSQPRAVTLKGIAEPVPIVTIDWR